MNPKVANLIAVELGILIGIMSWLAYSRFPSAEPSTAAVTKGKMVNSIRPVADVFEPRTRRPYRGDYGADRERARPVDDDQSTATTQEDDQEIATEPYASSGLGNGFSAAESPSYTEADQEVAAAQPDYAASPQTVIYAQPVQIVSFSNGRSFGHRRRSTRHSGELVSVIPRLPDRQVVPRLPDRQVVPRLPDRQVVPRLPDRQVVPRLPDSQVVPRLPDSAESHLNGRGVTSLRNPNTPTRGCGPRANTFRP
jgi:hypothetical protein